jgi:hypothetical protein
MATPAPFDAAISAAGDTVTGYIGSALPVVLGVAAAFLGIKYGRKLIRGL